MRASQIFIVMIVGLCFAIGLCMHIGWNNLSILQARSLDEYVFIEPLLNIYNGIKAQSLEQIFSFIFYSYGFFFFFLNFLSTFLYLDQIMDPGYIISVRVLTIAIFCSNIFIFYKIIDQNKVSKIERIILLFILFSMPAIWIFSGYIHPTFIMISMFLASILSMIKANKEVNKFYWFSIALYGFALSFKFQAIIFFPFYIWIWLGLFTNHTIKNAAVIRSIIKSLFLIFVIFIVLNPYVLSSQGFDAWIASLNANLLSNESNHGNDGRVLLIDKLNFALFNFYFGWYVLIVLIFVSVLIMLNEVIKKSFSVYGGIASFFLVYFFYLIFFVNKSWAIYFLPLSIPAIIILINIPETLNWRTYKINKFRLTLVSSVLLINLFNNFEFNKKIFGNHFSGNSISYDAIYRNEIKFVTLKDELQKSKELAEILKKQSGQFDILTTPYVNFPFQQLNMTYSDINIIFDFNQIIGISETANLSKKDLILIVNRRYENEINEILDQVNSNLIDTTNDYLLFSLIL